MSHLRNHQLDH